MKKEILFITVLSLIIIFLIPHILGYLTLKNYYPCNANVMADDCVWYTARYVDFYDGNFFVEDNLIYENKQINISALPLIDTIIYGFLLFLFLPFTSINGALIIIKTTFFIINFLLLRMLGNNIFKDELYSLFFSIIIVTHMLWKEFLLVAFYVFSLISEDFTGRVLSFFGRDIGDLVFATPLIFERAPRPNLVFIFLTLSIILLLKILENKKIKRSVLVLYGLGWSTLFYAYFFFYVPFFISVVFLLLIYFFKNKNIFRKLKLTFFSSLLFSIPYWWNYFNFKNSNFYTDYTLKIGIEQGHFIRFLDSYFSWLGMLVIFFLLRKKIKKEWFYFCLTFFIGIFIGLNIQLVIGFNPQPDHWVTKVMYFLLAYMILTVFYVLISKLKEKYKKIIICGLITVILIFASVWQIRFFEDRKLALSLPDEEVELYDWLNKIENTSVILTDSALLKFNIPFYTKHDLFFPHGPFTILTSGEVIDRALKTYAILNYSADEFNFLFNRNPKKYKNKKELIKDIDLKIHQNFQKIETHIDILGMKQEKTGLIFKGFMEMNESFNEEDINKFVKEYKKIKTNKTINLPGRVDYIVTKKDLEDKTPFENLNIKEIFKNKEYFVYKLNKLQK